MGLPTSRQPPMADSDASWSIPCLSLALAEQAMQAVSYTTASREPATVSHGAITADAAAERELIAEGREFPRGANRADYPWGGVSQILIYTATPTKRFMKR